MGGYQCIINYILQQQIQRTAATAEPIPLHFLGVNAHATLAAWERLVFKQFQERHVCVVSRVVRSRWLVGTLVE